MRCITWSIITVSRNHIFVSPNLTLPIHHNSYGTTMTIKGSLYVSIPIVKRFSDENFVPSKPVQRIAIFRENEGLNIKRQKPHPCTEPGLWCILYEDQRGGLGCRRNEEPKNEHRPIRPWGVIGYFPIWKEKTLDRSGQNFALGRHPGVNHRCKFFGRSVKAF